MAFKNIGIFFKKANLKVYVGGTLFEAFVIRNKFEDYIKYISDLGIDSAEVSDGSIEIDFPTDYNLLSSDPAIRVISPTL